MSAASPFERQGARERQRQETRARLYEASLAEFARVGFDRASVAEIARVADVSRPSFYFHFPTKEHVLLELQWRKELEVVERIRGCSSLREMLLRLPDAFVDSLDSLEGETTRDMLRIYSRRRPDLPLDDQPFPVAQEVIRHFVEGEARGELREGLEPETAAVLCLASVFGYLMTALPGAEHRGHLRTIVGLYLADPAATPGPS